MSSPSLDSQIASVRFALSVVGRSPPHMRPAEVDMHEQALKAAIATLEGEKIRRQTSGEAIDRMDAEHAAWLRSVGRKP